MTDLISREAAIELMEAAYDEAKASDETATSAIARMIEATRALPAVGVKPLVWVDGDRNGGHYCEVSIGHGFSAYYQITQEPYDLATVEFGINCHEFGGKEIWKGPKSEAKAATQDDYARIMAALTGQEGV